MGIYPFFRGILGFRGEAARIGSFQREEGRRSDWAKEDLYMGNCLQR